MTLNQSDLKNIRQSHGAENTLGDGDTPPYGFTLVGAINQLERIASQMDEYGVSYADLPADKQTELDRAHEAFQHHIKNLSNLYADNVVGNDDSIELPSGNTVSLPKQPLSGSASKNLPSPPQ